MWFRVELHKDGSVAKCETVEGKLKDGKHVFYVEADTKEKALARAVASYRKERERNAANMLRIQRDRREKRLCTACGAPAAEGRSRCELHRQREADLARERRAGARPPPPKRTLTEQLVARREADLRAKEKINRRSLEQYGASLSVVYRQRKTLREVLAAYDRSPRNFRAWLVARLMSLGVDANADFEQDSAEPFAFEAAAE